MWLFLAFVAVPVIEIALFIQIGGMIGTLSTIAIVVLTAFLGAFLVRQQGARTLGQIRSSFADMTDPTEPLVHGAMILFAGALLLTPGFFTDAVGLSLMVPAVRIHLFHLIRSSISTQHFTNQPQPQNHRSDVIDGDYHEVPPRNQPSGWTKH